MGEVQIKDLEKVLKYTSNSDKVITNIKTAPLVAAGENFGSILSKLEVTVKQDNKEETIHIVAKSIPKDEYLQKLFDVQVTVKKEIAFYEEIVPTLQTFQRQYGVEDVLDLFPKCYGSRINLNGSDRVDEDSVILLENLKEAGFKNADRFVGYDFETARLIIKDLATFQSTSLALKLHAPQEFEKTIKSNCGKYRRCPKPPKIEGKPECGENLYYTVLYESDKCLPYISTIKELLKPPEVEYVPTEPFAAFAHGDFWVNNHMVLYEEGKAVESKLVDFQVYAYNSPMTDLFLFLWTSVRKSVLEEHLDDLLLHYHTIFIKNLKMLQCDTGPFEWKYFMEELKVAAREDFEHVLFMMFFIIFGGNDPSKDNSLIDFSITSRDIPLEVKEKIWYTVQECGRRGWI